MPDKSAERGLWSWARSQWDPDTGFVFNPPGGYHELGSLAGRHVVREVEQLANDRLGLDERVQIDSDGPLAIDETWAGRVEVRAS